MWKLTASALSAASFLAACGGGDGGQPQPMASAPVRPVLLTVASTAATYTASGPNGLTFALTIAPGPAQQLTTALPVSSTYDATAVLRQNGTVTSTSTYRVFYMPEPFKVLGAQIAGNVGPINWVANQNATIPESAATLASGLIFSAPTPSSTLGVGPLSATWTVEPGDATSAFVCTNTARDGGLVTRVQTLESDCFKVNGAGVILGFKATLTTNGAVTAFE